VQPPLCARQAVETVALPHRVEQLALLSAQHAALSGECRIPRRTPRAHIGDLPDRVTRQVEEEDVVVSHEVRTGAIGGDRRARFVLDRLREPPRDTGAHVHEIQIALVCGELAPAVAREAAVREQGTCRIDLQLGETLGCRARRGAHPKGSQRLAPFRARLAPVEVDVASVRAPAHPLRLASVQLGAAHEIGDGEGEGGTLLGDDWRGRPENDRQREEMAHARSLTIWRDPGQAVCWSIASSLGVGTS
jgi:hypothetical protein